MKSYCNLRAFITTCGPSRRSRVYFTMVPSTEATDRGGEELNENRRGVSINIYTYEIF